MSHKIAVLSKVLSIASSLFIVVIPITVISIWLLGSEETLLSGFSRYWFIPAGILFHEGTLTQWVRVFSAGISLLANLPLLASS